MVGIKNDILLTVLEEASDSEEEKDEEEFAQVVCAWVTSGINAIEAKNTTTSTV
jgi:hypothetical protein